MFIFYLTRVLLKSLQTNIRINSNNIFAGVEQNQLKIRAYGGSVIIKDIQMYKLKE